MQQTKMQNRIHRKMVRKFCTELWTSSFATFLFDLDFLCLVLHCLNPSLSFSIVFLCFRFPLLFCSSFFLALDFFRLVFLRLQLSLPYSSSSSFFFLLLCLNTNTSTIKPNQKVLTHSCIPNEKFKKTQQSKNPSSPFPLSFAAR